MLGWVCYSGGVALLNHRLQAGTPAGVRVFGGTGTGGVARGLAQPPAPMKDVKQQVRLPIREGREGALRAVFSGFRGGR